jgi:hypothetical protein
MFNNYTIFKNIITLREKFINLFQKKILLLEKNKQLIDNKIIIFFVNRFYNFGLNYIFKYNNINVVYKIDNLIFYDENKIKKLYVNGIIIDSTIYKENNKLTSIDFLNVLKKYSLNIPISIIIKLEKIDLYDVIKIKFLKNGVIKTKKFIFKNIINMKLYELLQKN